MPEWETYVQRLLGVTLASSRSERPLHVFARGDGSEEADLWRDLLMDAGVQVTLGEPGSDLVALVSALRDVEDGAMIALLEVGDRPRPELLPAVEALDLGAADVVLFDQFVVGGDSVFPLLLPGVDPLHGRDCDYWYGRALVRAGFLRDAASAGATDPQEVVREAVVCGAGTVRHLPLPLVGLPGMPTLGLRGRSTSAPEPTSSVGVVICTHNNAPMLVALCAQLLAEPSVADVVIVSNNTSEPEALAALEQLAVLDGVTILRFDEPFNFSRQCNLGARVVHGEQLLFLNDDIVALDPGWVAAMRRWVVDAPNTVVGPLLLYPDETLQHAGMYFGVRGSAGHYLRRRHLHEVESRADLQAAREVSCLTGAALMVDRGLYEQLNGFDPMLATYLQDVDLCLRLRASGARLVLDPTVRLVHHESVSVEKSLESPRTQRIRGLEFDYFCKRWPRAVEVEDLLHPLLSLGDESMRTLRGSLRS